MSFPDSRQLAPLAVRCSAIWLAVFMLAGCGSGDSSAPETKPAGGGNRAVQTTAVNPGDVPLPKFDTAVCRIDTTEPGFAVLIDGEPVRDEDDALLVTPCEVTLLRGSRTVTVARKGWLDDSQVVQAGSQREVLFDPRPDASGTADSILTAEYFNAPVGEPIALTSVNSSGRELDPFVTPDGLSIWFAGERAEGRGIFVATRPSPSHPFGPPEFLLETRGFDLPATPSVTQGGLALVYAVPEKARILALTRRNPFEEFSERKALQFTRAQTVWPSAQILADGLRLYWQEQADGGAQTFAVVRSNLERDFSAPIRFDLPGGHPCLSHDGLRQYAFDGRQLQRARRADIVSRFSALETIAEVELSNYVPAADRRQYFVSDDEQWLFYCDDPSAGSDLYMVRLFERRNWGFASTGKRVAPRPVAVAAVTSEPSDTEKEPTPASEPIDPRTLPLPYTAHWQKFTAAIGARNYEEAERLARAALTEDQLADDRDLLAWDVEDAGRLQQFWKDARQATGSLPTGTEIRLGPARVELVEFADDVLTVKAGTAEARKPLHELLPADLVALVDRTADRDDAAAQLRIGVFLYYDPRGNERLARLRFDRAGTAGREFVERLATRTLRQAEQEFAREHLAAGLKLIDEIRSRFADTPAAAGARKWSEDVYTLIRWEPAGPRRWESPAAGEFVANTTRAPGSLLVSPRPYRSFELRLEWQTRGAAGQGGVYFRWPRQGRPSDAAFKVHLANDHGQPPDMFATGSLFKIAAPRKNAVRPEGQWNTLTLRVEGDRARAAINGDLILDTTLPDDTGSPTGHIALDGEIGGITYRKLLLIELPDGE